ncbi:hypothetical protein IHV25_02235 [Phaeovibrio sulfidiphilus]|uniref:Uncharacterized protein n=1 Tax=Phaeovibrio sulfidiphilus TaxID=1220600 RepID=A0A8J6YHR0_9PROT|nr:hypothetical protein [Phaeovibrio sulfidiphilus]MBE1236471.1 hypothetical protein [Phaeovibrio sulfidiphilus]
MKIAFSFFKTAVTLTGKFVAMISAAIEIFETFKPATKTARTARALKVIAAAR